MQLNAIAQAVAAQRPAVCFYVENIMDPMATKPVAVPAGTRVRSLLRPSKVPPVCRVNGEWVLRREWDYQLQPGDRVEFVEYPQGGGDGGSDATRIVLTIAALYLAVQFGQYWAAEGLIGGQALGTAVAQIALMSIVNQLVPTDTAQAVGSTEAPGNYSANLSGNQARLEQAIPVLYGRNKTFPDFAAQSYVTYANDDQYYHALLTIGQGEYEIEAKLIDDTNLSNFADVQATVLEPGQTPTYVSALVVNAAEVSGNPLTEGRYIGPFIGCRPKDRVGRIGIDIGFSRGLATYDSSGVPGDKTVTWRVEYRAVDDFGAPLSAWIVVASESLTAAQTKPLRRSYEYQLPSTVPWLLPGPPPFFSCRPQVRLVRTSPFDNNSRVANTIEWLAWRCYLDKPAPLCPTATHLELKMRATDQLSGLTQRRIAVISRRKLRTWTGTDWTAPAVTRNPAWAQADKWTNTVYGDKYPDDRCDLDGLKDLAALCEARQDRFDGVFDQTYDSHKADQMICQSMRASAFRRNGLMTVSRDEVKPLPVTGFSSRNIHPGTLSIDYAFATENTPDGVIVEYWDNRKWDWDDTILCPAPGVAVPERPVRLRLFGVTGRTHAEREGVYQAANSYYRRKFPSFGTELEGMLPAFGSAVVFAPSLQSWGLAGDVVSYNPATLELQLSEPVTWVSGSNYFLTLIQRKGEPTTPVPVLRGQSDFHVILPAGPSFILSYDQANEERTKFILSTGTVYPSILRVLGIRNSGDDSGVRTYTLNGVIEDDRVHTADNHLLPVDGEIQDDVDNPGDDGSGSGTAVIPYLEAGEFSSLGGIGGTASTEFRLVSNGFAEVVRVQDGSAAYEYPTGQWLLDAPRDVSDTGLFGVRATLLRGTATGTFGSLLALSTTRTWSVSSSGFGGFASAVIQLEIVEVATGIAQVTAIITLNSATQDSTGG